jgi:PAS domain S-box-containing protein
MRRYLKSMATRLFDYLPGLVLVGGSALTLWVFCGAFRIPLAELGRSLRFGSLPTLDATGDRVLATMILATGIGWTLLTAVLLAAWRKAHRAARTETEQISASLRMSEAEARKLALVADRTDNVVTICDAHGCVEWVNRSFSKATGYGLEEIRGKHPAEFLYGPRTDPQTAASLRSKARRGESFSGEIVFYTKRGCPAWTQTEVQPIPDRSGGVSGFMTISSDITDRKRAEKELQEQEKQYRGIFEAVTSGLLIFNLRGEVVEANPAACRMYGEPRRHMVGLPAGGFLREPALPPFREIKSRIHSEGRFSMEATALRSDGCQLDVEFCLSAFRFQGRPHLLAVVDDVSERKATQQHLRDYADALQAANRCLEDYSFKAQAATEAKSEFLANMSHEIRTPMTAILGFAEVLRSEGDISKAPKERIEAIDTLLRNGNYLLRLINGVLDLSKIEAGRVEIERVPTSPKQIVDDVFSLLGMQARSKGLCLRIDYRSAIPELIETDPTRLRQILINLVGNALKFTERGEVCVEVNLLRRSATDAQIAFTVADTGIGISADQQERIFEPFAQADQQESRRETGTGLGLAISRQLARALGGDLTLESEPGAGSRFCLRIETGPLGSVPLVHPSGERSARGEEPDLSADHGTAIRLSARVLLAEDGLDNQRLVSFMLERAGAEVTAVENGKLAVDEVLSAVERGSPYDVVLMDMQMPVMDGYQATARLREEGYRGPIVALTAQAMTADRQRCLAAGCDDYATKPIERASLLSLVAKHAALGAHASR